MDSVFIQKKIIAYITANSGLDQGRTYLGISKIADCQRRAFREYFNGPTLTPESHVNCFMGYEHERLIMQILISSGIAKSFPDDRHKEIVSTIDPRFRGHIDGIATDESLLEIKSVSTKKFIKIMQTGRALYPHFSQVQLYMRYGNFPRALIVYRNRETYEHIVIDVPYIPSKALQFEERAKSLLQAIDDNRLPACECGYCHD